MHRYEALNRSVTVVVGFDSHWAADLVSLPRMMRTFRGHAVKRLFFDEVNIRERYAFYMYAYIYMYIYIYIYIYICVCVCVSVSVSINISIAPNATVTRASAGICGQRSADLRVSICGATRE